MKREFIVECLFVNGNVEQVGVIDSEQSLLNDYDLKEISEYAWAGDSGYCGRYHEMHYTSYKTATYREMIMVRAKYNTDMCYYQDADGWTYGSMKDAENVLKKRL